MQLVPPIYEKCRKDGDAFHTLSDPDGLSLPVTPDGGIQYLHDNQIVVECGKIGGQDTDFSPDNSFEVAEGVAGLLREGGCLERKNPLFPSQSAQLGPVLLIQVAPAAVDNHIFPVIRPAPGAHDLDRRSRVPEHKGCVVIDFRISLRLVVLQDGEDGFRSASGQEPGCQIRPVASEINDGKPLKGWFLKDSDLKKGKVLTIKVK